MPLIGNNDQANNAPKWVAGSLWKGSGKTAEAANNTALYSNATHNSFIDRQTVGVLAATPAKMANTTGEGKRVPAPGWNLRRAGQGPVVSVAVVAGTGFANGETATLSGGTTNSTITLTSNATQNLASGSVTLGGLFTNTGEVSVAFNREKHLTGITVGGTPTGYNNTDVFTVTSNQISNGTFTVSTNSTGGFVTANVTLTNVGLWDNSKVAANLTVSAANSTGGASAGSGGTFTPVLANSSGGTITATLGGRSGRVTYECLVTTSSLTSNNTASSANTILPE